MAYTYSQLKGIWLNNATGQYKTNAWASLMAAIAEAESRGDPLATNPTDNNGTQTSWGLFQISDGTHAAPSPSWSDPATQVRLAIGKLNSQGLGAWGTYTSGAYQAYLSDKTAADLTAAGGPSHVDTAATAAAASTQANCAWGIGSLVPNPSIGGFHPLGSFQGGLCLLSKSQARAIVGVGLLGFGLFTTSFGLVLVLKAAGAFAAMERAGGGAAETAGVLATLSGNPEVGAPLAAGGAAVRSQGVRGAARQSADRRVRASRAQERRDNRTANEVESRRRDSARGPALRNEPAPF